MEIDPLNPKKALDNLSFCVLVPLDEEAFQALEKEIGHLYFKDRRGRFALLELMDESGSRTEDI
jgi:hypothetical protein